jgi:plastocyanin
MPRTRATSLLALAALLPAGCGDAGPAVRTSAPAFTVTLDDYLLRPQAIRVAKGGRIAVTAVNRGRLGHTLFIRKGERIVLRIRTLRPGASATLTRRLTPGKYELFCTLANHEELGMRGTLTVR